MKDPSGVHIARGVRLLLNSENASPMRENISAQKYQTASVKFAVQIPK